MRLPVDPTTLNPAGAPQLVATGSQWDDFDIDQDAGVAHIHHAPAKHHRAGTARPHSGQAKVTVAGIPFDEQLIGPSDFAWGRRPHDFGSVAYITTDGGVTAAPPDGIFWPAKLLTSRTHHSRGVTLLARPFGEGAESDEHPTA
jgi:hypothetical protein